jgi:hypothetical protein
MVALFLGQFSYFVRKSQGVYKIIKLSLNA